MTLASYLTKSYVRGFIFLLGILLLYAGYRFFAFNNTWTNDVYVSAQVLNLVSKSEGVVLNVYVQENQAVKKGDKIIQVEDTLLSAPVDGFITNFKVYPGQYVTKGQGICALIDTSKWWLVARYRETVLRLIQPGKRVRITLDMYPGKVFHGYVQSIGWGIDRQQAGDTPPSPLIYMKPTEYWIKIAQRFPVIINFKDLPKQYPLRVGASGTTWVDPSDAAPSNPISNAHE